MGYQVDYRSGEQAGCSNMLTVADRIFYVKHFNAGPSKFYSGDQQGIIQKEISKTEFDLWVSILADNGAQEEEIQKMLALGKKY